MQVMGLRQGLSSVMLLCYWLLESVRVRVVLLLRVERVSHQIRVVSMTRVSCVGKWIRDIHSCCTRFAHYKVAVLALVNVGVRLLWLLPGTKP